MFTKPCHLQELKMVTKLWAAQLEPMGCVINGCKIKKCTCACERKDFIHYSPTTNTWFYNVLYCLGLRQISQQHIFNEQTILEPMNHNKKKHRKYKNHRAWLFAVRQALYLFWLHTPKDKSNPELLTFSHTDSFQGKYTAKQANATIIILKFSWLDRTDKSHL